MSEYVVLKLCTGDQLMAEVENETLDGISVLNPIQVKSFPVVQDGEYGEQVVSNRYCPFSEDTQFTFNYKDIIYCKDLNPIIVKYYQKLVLAFGEESKDRDAFYKQASDEEVEKVQQELSNLHIKLH